MGRGGHLNHMQTGMHIIGKKQSVRFMAREGFELEWSDLGAQING